LHFRAAGRIGQIGRLQVPGAANGHALDALALRSAGAGPFSRAADCARGSRHQERHAGGGCPLAGLLLDQSAGSVRGPAQALTGTLIAVDGNPVAPLQARQFPLAIAQRADIMLRVPADNAVPILARGEGRMLQTGVILRPPGAAVTKIASDGMAAAPAVGLE